MKTQNVKNEHQAQSAMKYVRAEIYKNRDKVWMVRDFPNLSSTAVSQALSRLQKRGEIVRLSRGVYYRSRKTTFGESRPNPSKKLEVALKSHSIFPAGLSAANLLGLSTQIGARNEVSTTAQSLPRKLIGEDTIVHTRRPLAWEKLNTKEAALLDVLRQSGRASELSSKETTETILQFCSKQGIFEKLARVAESEFPKVRAMLGAIGEEIGADRKSLEKLRASLNSLSRFDFGKLSELRYARKWQMKT